LCLLFSVVCFHPARTLSRAAGTVAGPRLDFISLAPSLARCGFPYFSSRLFHAACVRRPHGLMFRVAVLERTQSFPDLCHIVPAHGTFARVSLPTCVGPLFLVLDSFRVS
jgi:hypothetical protein